MLDTLFEKNRLGNFFTIDEASNKLLQEHCFNGDYLLDSIIQFNYFSKIYKEVFSIAISMTMIIT